MPTSGKLERFWNLAPDDLMAQLGADPNVEKTLNNLVLK